MSNKKENTNEEVVITDEFGNEIVDGLEVTVPADIAEENGAHEDDAHELDEASEDSTQGE
jgi:hypothetical protein